MIRLLWLFEILLVILGILFFSGGLYLPFLPSLGITALRYSLWLVLLALLGLRWRSTLKTLQMDLSLGLFVGLSLLSVLWSEYPSVTQFYARDFVQMTLFGLYLAARFSAQEQLLYLAAGCGLSTIVSAVLAIALPQYGVHQTDHLGAWRGIYIHKNNLGAMMVVSTLVFYLLTTTRPKRGNGWLWGGLFFSIALVLLSTSKTALVLMATILLFSYGYRHFRWQGRWSVVLFSLAIMLIGGTGLLLFANWATLTNELGRDVTLSGRTQIWGLALEQLQYHPWLGFGRRAFFAEGGKYALEAGKRLSLSLTYFPPHAHNGFLDLTLDVGLIGLSLFLLSLGRTYVSALKLAYRAKTAAELWPLSFLTLMVMNNLTESLLVSADINIFWPTYVAIALSVPRQVAINATTELPVPEEAVHQPEQSRQTDLPPLPSHQPASR
jgi:O-antigen ligase